VKNAQGISVFFWVPVVLGLLYSWHSFGIKWKYCWAEEKPAFVCHCPVWSSAAKGQWAFSGSAFTRTLSLERRFRAMSFVLDERETKGESCIWV